MSELNYKLKLAPGMQAFYDDLERRIKEKTANADEQKLWKQLGKTLKHLAQDPRYPGLASHKIEELKGRYPSEDVWESYIENRTPGAKRIFWRYGPGSGVITITAIERHPESARDYRKVQ